MELYELTTYVYRDSEESSHNPKIHQFLVKNEEKALEIMDRFWYHKPWIRHCNELLQLFLSGEKEWLVKTAKYSSVLEFFYSGEWEECKEEEELICEIMRLEFFNYDIKTKTIDFNKPIMYSSDVSYF